MKTVKLGDQEIYKNIANYIFNKYHEKSLDQVDEIKFLLNRFNLKRKDDFVRTYNILTNIYYKNFNKFIYKKEGLLRIRITKKLFIEIIKNKNSITIRKIEL